MGDYVCWSASVDDLGNWRYEGVIYPRNEDPLNKDGKMCLYAPDVTVGPDGSILQAELTSCGLNGKALTGKGEYPAYIANIQDSATAGFKYFDCQGIKEIRIRVRGYADGIFEVRTAWDGEVLARIKVEYTNVWEEYAAPVPIPDGKQAIYLTYRGNGNASLLSFTLVVPEAT